MAAKFYPVFVALQGKICLVVGGGAVGERKVRKLFHYGAAVHLVARELTGWLQEQVAAEGINLLGPVYEDRYLDQADLVFAATSDPELNRRIADQAARRRIWCNMATDPELGSLLVPASFERGPLTVAISTSGMSPAAAAAIRRTLERQFEGAWSLYLTLLGELRTAIQAKTPEHTDHQQLFRTLAGLPLLEWIEAGRERQVRRVLSELCGAWLSPADIQQIWDQAWKSCS